MHEKKPGALAEPMSSTAAGRRGSAGPGAGVLLVEALRAFRNGRDEQAATLCTRVLAAEPLHLEAGALLALAQGLGPPDDAALCTEQGRLCLEAARDEQPQARPEQTPDQPQSSPPPGDTLQAPRPARDLLDLAQARLERAVELGGGAPSLALLGTAHRLQGRTAEASQLFRRALALDPGQLDAWLGVAALLCRQGNAAAAAQRLDALAALHPGAVALWAMLGDIHDELGHHGRALQCYEHVLDGHPEHLGCRLGLARCLAQRPLLAPRLRSPRHLAESLEGDVVDPEQLTLAAVALLRSSPSPLEDPLLLAVLRRAVLTDLTLERALTQARRALCLAPPGEAPELAHALAVQCTLNEAAWAVSPEEEDRLPSSPAWVRAMYEPEPVSAELLERARRLPSLTPVSAGTSAAVRELYEANPYPRWRQFPREVPRDLDQALRALAGGDWDPPAYLRRPRLLVAGCGTGRDLLSAAWAWRPASVTGFDLSRTSLAYAQQMAGRFGVEAELYQADLLRLDEWDRRFDVIMCTGVLHHLDDPVAGWRRLLRLLRPGGVMLVGLYSDTARRGVAAAQTEVRRLGLPPTAAGIRVARAHLAGLPRDHPAFGCTALRDFFYVSGCRDMLIHVREHRFTVARISAALDELGLTFLGFKTDGATRRLYRTLFGPGTDLACWETLEQLYPQTFLGMYQFWCQDGRST